MFGSRASNRANQVGLAFPTVTLLPPTDLPLAISFQFLLEMSNCVTVPIHGSDKVQNNLINWDLLWIVSLHVSVNVMKGEEH